MRDEHEGLDSGMDDFERNLTQELKARYSAPAFPAERIEARLERSVTEIRVDQADRPTVRRGIFGSPAFRSVMAAAAALVLFIGGAEYGRWSAEDTLAIDPGLPGSSALSLPVSIQSAGSDYIATLAQLSGSQALTSEEADEAKEIALAVFYGAVLELMRDDGQDEMLATIAQLLHSRRQSLRNPGTEGAIWF